MIEFIRKLTVRSIRRLRNLKLAINTGVIIQQETLLKISTFLILWIYSRTVGALLLNFQYIFHYNGDVLRNKRNYVDSKLLSKFFHSRDDLAPHNAATHLS